MKTLQNNFTTPEQSKRLLELGVPADSADCYYTSGNGLNNLLNVRADGYEQSDNIWKTDNGYINSPCWSVGRLIEISRICSTLPEEEYMFPFWYDTQDNIEWAIRVIESGIITGNMDFSKLEE